LSRIACIPPADEGGDEEEEGNDGRGKGKRKGKEGRD
jgi:hypothetical protein